MSSTKPSTERYGAKTIRSKSRLCNIRGKYMKKNESTRKIEQAIS